MSLWESVKDLKNYVYRSTHAELIKQRREWFRKSDSAYMALWWVPAEHIPSPEEGMQRLAHLCEHGETPYAFSFKKSFEAKLPTENEIRPSEKRRTASTVL